ncbi:ABC-type transport system periplasmic substrate-binding protein (probable substrate branched-chain amino acids) [Natronomonas moolapensis 8.8.11]|uniref:ABC-type transport system periplasmic substrate-binding protein (Probable substrate branched-chain amino acids) n=1 Tax=Natronomonas moolapensis (strain DSM 18674 / CECT 7526 / JCM 14361 / 8.8.11) TaxID=268739 RepID=M1XQY1_NATM8|nr:ABC transporter substrate-binding protein [Natronomonas moolapensis]CCQ36589.1 ABC-type transport system periplasmic substrate-binding protein (probable substrate branched-chain amino acids) [Natronomonas moolapensis 8.8.11]
MSRKIDRRDVLKGAGVTGLAALAGCTGNGNGTGGNGNGTGGNGNGTDTGGDSGSVDVDVINVIGYPEDGNTLFRNYYELSDGSEDIIVPDGLRDGELQQQVGNPMENVVGTAPAAGGPAQEAFSGLYENEYGETPGVFTTQSYDSVAVGILANVAAGENSGTGIRDQMRNVANPDGMEVTPENFVEGVEAVANGDPINYQGASSDVNFNEAGDPANAAYDVWEFTGDGGTEATDTLNFEGDSPDGAGPSADTIEGGLGRTVDIGILLPETGNLASVGEGMINAAEIPAMQVNEADVDIEVETQLEDTNTEPNTGIQAANSLVNAGVPYICGSASSGVNVPVAQQALIPNQVVGCSPSSTALSVTNLEDDDYIFRTAPSDLLQGRVMAQVASEQLGAEVATTLYVNNDYGQQLSEQFASVFEADFGGTVEAQVAYNQNEDSYTSAIQEAIGGN